MAHLSLSLLDVLQISLERLPVTTLKYHKAKALLAYLAAEADRSHSRASLAGLLWPDLPDETALKNLSQTLSNLRRALGDPEADCPFLLISVETIQFNPASDHELDVATFEELLATCEAHIHRSVASCSACARRLDQAAALYRDDFLAHFALGDSAPFDEWSQAKREALRQEALRALRQLADYHARHRHYEQAEALARRQLALDPWREPAHRQVMRLLALTGQRNAALAHYDDFRRGLAQELDAPPEPETTALYEQLRVTGQAGLAAGASPARKIKLPTRLEPFIGREQELAEIAGLLEQPGNRLLTLVGPGGIGKTRLAIEAVRRHAPEFVDGVFFVPLAALTTADAVVTAMTSALEIDAPGASDPKRQLLSFVREKELLLVLDSVEQLLADEPAETALASLVGDVLEQAPGVSLLVTSRERLRLTGEQIFMVPGLHAPPPNATERLEDYDAVKLFVACARRANPAFRLTVAEAGDVAWLCHFLEGMPLGIEMAAAWVDTISCQEITAEIGRSLDFLQAPTRDVPKRHRSLRAAFDYTWRLLTDEERWVFRQLAVFRGGFDREAAEQVASATVVTLVALVNKSWVQRIAVGRYDLHELIRQYGLAQLAASGVEDATRQRHAQYYCDFAERLAPVMRTSERQSGLDQLALELGNLRAALAWDLGGRGQAQEALRLSNALMACQATRGMILEGNAWLLGGLARDAEVPEFIVARAYLRAGTAARWLGDGKASQQYLEQALEVGRQVGDARCVAWTLYELGYRAFVRLDHSAEVWLTEGLDLFRQLGDPYGMACQLVTLGMLSRAQGEFERAQVQFTESLALYQQVGDIYGIADATTSLGKVARSRGDYDRAAALYNEALALDQAKGYQFDVAETTMEQGLLAHLRGDDEQAQALLIQSLMRFRELDHYNQNGYCLAWLGAVAAAQRQPERAARLLGAAAVQFEAASRRLGVAEQTEYDRALAATRDQLDEAKFAAAWAEGQALTREQAIELALRT